MTDFKEWIKTADRLPEPYIHDYVWVAGEMKYNHEEECEKFVDIGWLNPDNEKETEDCYKWSTINDWWEGQQYFKITHWAEIKFPHHPYE